MTLRTEYQKLSQDSLKSGFVMGFYDRGKAETLANLQFKPHNNDSHSYNVHSSRGTAKAARDPFVKGNVAQAGGGLTRPRIYKGQLLLDFDVPRAASGGMSDTNDPTAVEAMLAADQFFDEFLTHMFHGDGSYQIRTSGVNGSIVGNNLNGWDYYLDQYSGKYVDGTFTGAFAGNWYAPRWRGQKIFATTTEDPTATLANQAVLTYNHVDEALSMLRPRGGQTYIIMDRKSWLRVQTSLKAAGGNTQSMLIGEENYEGWAGKPIIVSDTAFAPLYTTGEIAVGDLDQLVIDGDFIGANDGMIGRVVTVTGADFSTAHGGSGNFTYQGKVLADNQTVIEHVTDTRSINLLHAAGGAVAANAAVTIEQGHGIYVASFANSNLDAQPLLAIYNGKGPATDSTYNVDTGEYNGTIAGFDVRFIGESQTEGAFDLYRADWNGQFLVENPLNLVRVTGYKLA